MTDDKFDPDESHFSDEELEAALAGFEKEFADDSVSGDASDTSDADKTADAASAKSDSDANDDTADKASADSGRPMTDDVTGSVADAVNEAMADYFSVAHYPLTKRFLKVGFSWSFYD